MLERMEESYTVTVYQIFKVNVSAYSPEEAGELAIVAVATEPELHQVATDYEAERD
jgi:hypothetical protein